MQYYVEIFVNVAMAGINTDIQNYLDNNPGTVVVFSQTLHNGVDFVSCLIVKR